MPARPLSLGRQHTNRKALAERNGRAGCCCSVGNIARFVSQMTRCNSLWTEGRRSGVSRDFKLTPRSLWNQRT